MTDNNDNNTGDKPENKDNVLQFPKGGKASKEKSIQQVATGNRPDPMVYRFYLANGDVDDVRGYLAAGNNQIIMGDEEGILLYLTPLDSILKVVRQDAEESEG